MGGLSSPRPELLAKLLRAVPNTVYLSMFDFKEHHVQVHFRGQECFLVPNAECGGFADKLNIYYIYEDSASSAWGWGWGARGRSGSLYAGRSAFGFERTGHFLQGSRLRVLGGIGVHACGPGP